MKFFLLLCFCVCFTSVYSQKKNNLFSSEEIIVGTNSITQNEIKGIQFNFNYDIYDIDIDSLQNNISLVLRKSGEKYFKNKGSLAVLNVEHKIFQWTKELKMSFDMIATSDRIIMSSQGKTEAFNKGDGKLMWTNDHLIRFVNYKLNIGYNRHLRSYNLSDGREIADRDLKDGFGWNDSKYINDSTLILACSGIHSINLLNGNGWDYEMTTGKKIYGGMIAGIAGGVAMAALFGVGVVPTGPDILHNLSSNLIIDSLIYLASHNELVCVNYSGKVIWKESLDEKNTGTTVLTIYKNNLLLINTGYAFKNNRRIEYGNPYLSIIDKATGKTIRTSPLKIKEYISDWKINSDTLILLLKNSIIKFNLLGDSIIQSTNLEENKYGNINHLLDTRNIYIPEDSLCTSFLKLDTTDICLLNEFNDVLVMNNDFQVYKKLKAEYYFWFYKNYNDSKVLINNSKTVFTNGENHTLLSFNFGKPRIVSNKIINVNKKTLTIADIN